MASYFKREFKRKDKEGSVTGVYTKWCGEFNYNGKTKTVYGKSKKECEEKIRRYTTDKITYGVELEKTKYTVSEWLYKHLFTNVHPNVQDSTFDRYMCLWTRHINDTNFGDTLISDVKQITIQEWFNTKSDIGKRAQSMLRYLLRQAFEWAIVNNYIRINPVTNIKLVKESKSVKKKNIDILSKEEQEKYISVLNTTKHKLFFLTALFTGMRRGELLALKWDNVDFRNKTITVCESIKRCKRYNADGTSENIMESKEPKTKNSNRVIPIPTSLSKILAAHQLKQDSSNNKLDLVFITDNGTTIPPEYVRLAQISLCKKAKIPYKNFHALRHTFATRLIENGTDIKTVSKLLGHSDVFITLNTYVHETMDSKRSATDVLEEQFKDFI